MDESSRTTQFSGVAGRVVREALGLETLFTGFVLAVVFPAVGYGVIRMTPEIAAPVLQAATAAVLARFALNGFHGEWRGSVLSSAGGSWFQVAAVAVRYLALNALWLVPLIAAGVRPEAVAVAVQRMILGTGGSFVVVLAVLYLAAAALAPPACLVASAGASSLAEAFSPSHWRACFAGRLGDLFLLYAVYLGTIALVVLGALPVVVLGAVASTSFAIFLAVVSVCFAGALSVTLLGRLAGFYAFGESPGEPAPAEAAGRPRVVIHPNAPAAPAGPAGPAEPSTLKKAPLMDGAARVQEAWRRFGQDPPGAIAWVTELCDLYAPHPHLLHALTLMKLKAGFIDQASTVAREAIELCLARGHVAMAAEVYKAFGNATPRLGLDRERVLTIAAALARNGDVRQSASAFAAVIVGDPHERRAIKGLLSLAESRLRPDGSAEEAAKIYGFLLERCADSPLVEDMRRGLESSRRRMVRA